MLDERLCSGLVRVVRLDPGPGLGRGLDEVEQTEVALIDHALLGERFEVESVLGQGAMGVVYRAKDRTTGAPVASSHI